MDLFRIRKFWVRLGGILTKWKQTGTHYQIKLYYTPNLANWDDKIWEAIYTLTNLYNTMHFKYMYAREKKNYLFRQKMKYV
jgi:hypothetical protein